MKSKNVITMLITFLVTVGMSSFSYPPILTTPQFGQYKAQKIARQLVGHWKVESWEEQNGGDLLNGQLVISEELVGTLTGITAAGRTKVVEQFQIQVLPSGAITMKGKVIEGYFFADNFTVQLNKSGDKLFGRSIDTTGDIIDAVFIKLEEIVI